VEPESPEGEVPTHAQKRQRSAGGTPGGGQAKRPKQTGQLSYARAAQEGVRVAVANVDNIGTQISRDDFVNIQKAIGRLLGELPEAGFTPRLVVTYWDMEAAIMVCQEDETRYWIEKQVPNMAACEGSRLIVVGIDALHAYKRVVSWFPGPVEDTELLFLRLRRLNRGLDTRNWRVNELKEKPKGVRFVLSIDSESITVLEGLRRRPFSGVGQAVYSLLGVNPARGT
jgi:RNase P/RNase MRP subunit POP5